MTDRYNPDQTPDPRSTPSPSPTERSFARRAAEAVALGGLHRAGGWAMGQLIELLG